jgi:copper resistance protein C
MTRGIVIAMVLAGLPFLRPPPAHAHAFLEHADPRVGSSVAAPRVLTLEFTEPIEAAFCRVEVIGPSGTPLETEAPQHPAPTRMTVTLPPLPPGDYTVHWSVVSVDTHPTEGRFTFSVKP